MRKELERRPLVFFLAALILGLTAVSDSWNLLFLPVLFTIGRPLPVRLWLTAGFVVGLAWMPQPTALATRGYLKSRAVVTSRPSIGEHGWSSRALVGGVPMFLTGDGTAPEEGQVLRVSGEATPAPWNGSTHGVFRVRESMAVQEAPPALALAERWHKSVADFLGETTLGSEDRQFLMALCFGSDVLSREEMREARTGGWLRLMSASGIQVLAVAALVEGLFRLLPIPRSVLLVILTLALAIYALAAGHHASTERAVLVAVLSRWAYFFRREPDALSAIALSGAVILLLDPLQVYGLGFHMTMVVVAAFSIFGVRISPRGRPLNDRIRVGASLLARGVAIGSLAGIPLVAQAMHEASLSGVIAAALLVTLVPVAVAGALGAQLLGILLPAAGLGFVEVVVAPLVHGMRAFLDLTLSVNASIAVPAFSGYALVIYYGLWLLLWRDRARPA